MSTSTENRQGNPTRPHLDEFERGLDHRTERAENSSNSLKGWLSSEVFSKVTLPQLLRGVGAIVIMAAALVFMMQSWSTANVLTRYYSFLGFTGLLCAAGFFCGIHNEDDRGARTFLALASAAVPAHFVVLAGMLLPNLNPAAMPLVPAFAAPGLVASLVATIVGVLAVGVVTSLAFRVLARGEAFRATLAYLLGNALILVPVRDPSIIAVMAGLAVIALVAFDRRVLSPTTTMRTIEGYMLRVMLAVPVGLLFSRTVMFYNASALFLSVENACAALIFFTLAVATRERRTLSFMLEWGAVAWSAGALIEFLIFLDGIFPIARGLELPLVCLPLAGLMFWVSQQGVVAERSLRRTAALLATGSMIVNLLAFPGLSSAFVCLCASLVTVIHGFKVEEKIPFMIGIFGIGYAVIYHVRFALGHYDIGAWGSLALVGVASVLAASFFERNEKVLHARTVALRTSFETWSA